MLTTPPTPDASYFALVLITCLGLAVIVGTIWSLMFDCDRRHVSVSEVDELSEFVESTDEVHGHAAGH